MTLPDRVVAVKGYCVKNHIRRPATRSQTRKKKFDALLSVANAERKKLPAKKKASSKQSDLNERTNFMAAKLGMTPDELKKNKKKSEVLLNALQRRRFQDIISRAEKTATKEEKEENARNAAAVGKILDARDAKEKAKHRQEADAMLAAVATKKPKKRIAPMLISA